MTEKWIVDDAGTLINMENRENYDYMEEVVDVLNKLSEENKLLKKELKTLWKYLKPFNNLARDYHLTYEQLYEITSEAIENGDSE